MGPRFAAIMRTITPRAAALSTQGLSTRGLSTRNTSARRSRRIVQSARHGTRYQGVIGGGGARRTPGPSPPLADSAARTDWLAPGYGHYRADHSKELIIQKTGAQESVFPLTGPGVCGKPPGVPGTRRGRQAPRGRPNTLSISPPHPPQGTPGRRYENCASSALPIKLAPCWAVSELGRPGKTLSARRDP